MHRKTFERRTVIKLGRQDERAMRRSRRGRRVWELVPGGVKFADLFPDLVGRELTIDNRGLELADQPRLLLCCEWLGANGYL